MNKNENKISDRSGKDSAGKGNSKRDKSMGSVPRILPVVPPEDSGKNEFPDVHPHLPQISGPGGGALLLMISPVRTGKCLYEYSMVETDNGHKYLKNIKIGDKVNSDKGYVNVNEVFYQGKKECHRIILENKCELILTEDHKLHTLDGMKALSTCINDMIITKNGMSKIISKEYYGNVECYDIQVENEEHRFFCNNISVSNSTIISNMLLGDSEMGFFDAQERFDSTTIISNTIANDITSRFLKQAFDTHDSYDDSIIDGIVNKQKSYSKEEQPNIAVILDDCLGSIRREARINHLASRYRHFNIRLLVISSQNFRACSPIIRQNATNVIVGSPFPNQKELGKLSGEYGDMFGGQENWLKIYKKATPEKYSFLHMDFQNNPPRAYRCFEELIAEGPNIIGEVPTLDLDEIPK